MTINVDLVCIDWSLMTKENYVPKRQASRKNPEYGNFVVRNNSKAPQDKQLLGILFQVTGI